jgi:hypothetical protein
MGEIEYAYRILACERFGEKLLGGFKGKDKIA